MSEDTEAKVRWAAAMLLASEGVVKLPVIMRNLRFSDDDIKNKTLLQRIWHRAERKKQEQEAAMKVTLNSRQSYQQNPIEDVSFCGSCMDDCVFLFIIRTIWPGNDGNHNILQYYHWHSVARGDSDSKKSKDSNNQMAASSSIFFHPGRQSADSNRILK